MGIAGISGIVSPLTAFAAPFISILRTIQRNRYHLFFRLRKTGITIAIRTGKIIAARSP